MAAIAGAGPSLDALPGFQTKYISIAVRAGMAG
jgi:hypothetical protein